MAFDFLEPVADEVLEILSDAPDTSLAKQIQIHSYENGLPKLENVQVAILGVREDRRALASLDNSFNFNKLRQNFYQLYNGNWHTSIVDLGDILPGESVDDTYYVVKTIVEDLINRKIIPIILGGGQDLVYAQYRGYDNFGRMVNLVNVDACFDLGDAEKEISDRSYVGKMVVDQPYNLFNYANLGYQTYFNSQEEIGLLDKLYFESYRLGELTADISKVEPVMRDADMVSIDINAIENLQISNDAALSSPNGFTNREICALARYAGISDKVSSFGFYQLQNLELSKNNSMLVSQILWYFIEGVNFRKNENNISSKKEFLQYKVPIQDEVLIFYKSERSGRWWIEIPYSSTFNNKLKKNTLLPCTYQDYLEACNQNIPERWFKARRKNEL
ncbi:formimidoylglutamase [Mesonia aquimarina]|uniref:formimidoylglutamase n=1 Tax=Mesonia aquimarina TaxID=1504967 RepID=UPI000EF59F3A|nr:formimidoylglutamase [Mesonia aquimarina]